MAKEVDILTLEEWAENKDFDANHQDKLTCNVSFSQTTAARVKYHARLCPRALAIHDPDSHMVYLQQHTLETLKLPVPTLSELGLERKYSSKDLRFSHLVPAVIHQGECFLLCFELLKENLFVSVDRNGVTQAVFTMSLHVDLNVLACAQNGGPSPTVACLYSCQNYFDKSNSLNIDIFQENPANLHAKRDYGTVSLRKTHTVPIFLSCLPNILAPVLLFHPLWARTLVCFNINSAKDDGQIPNGISEYDIQRKVMVNKTNLFGLSGGLSPLRAKFLSAVFSPDASVLVVGSSATNPEWCLHYASYILFDSVKYTVISKLAIPLHNHVLSCTRFQDDCLHTNSVLCSKSYSPIFSQCGQKMALVSCGSPAQLTEPNSSKNEDSLTKIHIYKLPHHLSLKSQSRMRIRRWIKAENIHQLPIPKPLKTYLMFL